MLTIEIPAQSAYDDRTNEFVTIGPYSLKLEHSLRSIAAWEARTHRSFFETELDAEGLITYIRCMTTNQVRDEAAYGMLRAEDVEKIITYMKDPMSAKQFPPEKKRKSQNERKGPMTSEDIYSAMIEEGIPYEFENRHFNWLMALIRTRQGPEDRESGNAGSGKKMSYRERQRWYDEINEMRKREWNTRG